MGKNNKNRKQGKTVKMPIKKDNFEDERFFDAAETLEEHSTLDINPVSSNTQSISNFSESDSDLECIPTLSQFRQHAWKRTRSVNVYPNNSMILQNNGLRKLMGKNGEYLEGKWKGNQLEEIFSLQFIHTEIKKTIYVRKQKPGYLFTFDEDDFVARVFFDRIEDIQCAETFTTEIKRIIQKKIFLVEILKSDLLSDRNNAYENFIEFLQNLKNHVSDNLDYSEDLFQIFINLEIWNKSPGNKTREILTNIIKNDKISNKMKTETQKLLDEETKLNEHKIIFPEVEKFAKGNLFAELQKIRREAINNHINYLRKKYISCIYIKAPHFMEIDHISQLGSESIFYITSKDMELFSDLLDIMKEEVFFEYISKTWENLFRKLREKSNHQSIKQFAPLTHAIYFYLCKSFQEIILEISNKTEIPFKDLFKKSKLGKWELMSTINWPTTSLVNTSLERQYNFIFKLIRHFSPGNYSDKNVFEYKSQSSDDKTLWKRIKNLVKSKTISTIPDVRLVWIHIIDYAIEGLISEEELQLFQPLLEGYANFIEKTKKDYYESFRVAAHNVIRFIMQTSPFVSKIVSNIDKNILMKQIESIKISFEEKDFDDFKDLVDVYNEYWKKRESVLITIPNKFPYGIFKQKMEEILNKIYNIVTGVLDKNVKSISLIKTFRAFNEFLEDLNAVEFDWYVKPNNIQRHDLIQVVNSNKNSYKVLDPETFLHYYSESLSKHYIINIVQDLLNCINQLLGQKKWSDDEILNATCELFSSIKKSFIYLKEQPDYISFDLFENESTKPFLSVVNNCNSCEDFKKRIAIIGDSFWYLRKQDEIDIEKALTLYSQEYNNTNLNQREILKNSFNRYLGKFNFYIEENLNKSNYREKIESITKEVKTELQKIQTSENFFQKWNSKFKQDNLPDLLAGLAAVWSIQASKDIAITGKSLKPHCIQILCILRLLSVDRISDGVDKHLAQVLTGQGKSLVLGLLSSLLALLGHYVTTVCYSEYLANRDNEDFKDFLHNFNIYEKVTYCTFNDMANDILKPNINGLKVEIGELVQNCIRGEIVDINNFIKVKFNLRNPTKDIKDTILLIDEVDVFFSDEFYGSYLYPCTLPKIPGLARIQEEIWNLACKNFNKNDILKEIENFVKASVIEENPDFLQFHKFLFKPGKYYILKDEDKNFIQKEYTNQSLYEEHLEKMIITAACVAQNVYSTQHCNQFKLDEDGFICLRRSNGIYSKHCFQDYLNTFFYFKLKEKDFSHKNFQNYGYFVIGCGKVSYAKLPEEYPLILGVSGTLTTLNKYEEKAVKEYYDIQNKSVMPSYFGSSHLKFNSNNDVKIKESEDEWLSEIFSHANSKISLGQSVLVFFDTDIEIDQFKKRFLSKFHRLHVLTGNTEINLTKKYIDEAGITETITLATRGMGRGVDYKTSVSVEKNGGVHVIQTFFSIDIKEETQIKGRTARKDNKGSYELILCKEHLIKDIFIDKSEMNINYDTLNINRNKVIEAKGSQIEESLLKSESSHKTTMKYLEYLIKKLDKSGSQKNDSTEEQLEI